MKHNKKRNTAFLYECLIKELTKSIIRKDTNRQKAVNSIIKEFFRKGEILKEELGIYNSVLVSDDFSIKHSDRLLKEAKIDFTSLNRKAVFNRQTELINTINKQLGTSVYSNFIPNYKDLATLGLFFQDSKLSAKKRIMLEENLKTIINKSKKEEVSMVHVDNLTYKTFVKKFNDTYDRTLRLEQKQLLTNYIVSFSDNGLGLKSYLNEEIGRLKSAVHTVIVESKDNRNVENFKKLQQKLDNYTQIPIDQRIVEEIFYIQDLIAEVSKNAG